MREHHGCLIETHDEYQHQSPGHFLISGLAMLTIGGVLATKMIATGGELTVTTFLNESAELLNEYSKELGIGVLFAVSIKMFAKTFTR